MISIIQEAFAIKETKSEENFIYSWKEILNIFSYYIKIIPIQKNFVKI